MATRAQDRRGAEAMSRDISARFRKRDPIIERLEASRDIAHKERDAALAKVAELEREMKRARICITLSRAKHSLEKEEWEKERADMRYKITFAAKHIGTLTEKLKAR
jgi:hypothetical protein